MLQILVIDDDLVMQMILKNTLQSQGYKVIVAKNGIEGISLAKKQLPALVICDWMMPEVDGLDVCRQLKLDQNLSSTFFNSNPHITCSYCGKTKVFKTVIISSFVDFFLDSFISLSKCI